MNMNENNQTASNKTPKFCDGCGKILFKFHSLEIKGACIFLKIDVSCKREPCVSNGASNKVVDLKIDLSDFKKLELQQALA